MNEKKLTQKQVEECLKNICHFNEEDLQHCATKLLEGFSVVVDAVAYMGNGKWVKAEKKARYKYKMIVPILSNDNTLYSTDLYEGTVDNAIRGKYATYRATRQKVVKVIAEVVTDYSIERFDFGYKDGAYGIYKLTKEV